MKVQFYNPSTYVALIVATLLLTPVAPAAGRCTGDCDSDGTVAVGELITAVNIALGSLPVSTCAACDTNANQMVEVNELIAAVNAALNGCEGTPTPTPTPSGSPTPTPTPSGSPTPTPTPSASGIIFINVLDPAIAMVTRADGVVATFFGDRDALGHPISITDAVVDQPDHDPAKRVQVTYAPDGLPQRAVIGNGMVFVFDAFTPPIMTFTVTSAEGVIVPLQLNTDTKQLTFAASSSPPAALRRRVSSSALQATKTGATGSIFITCGFPEAPTAYGSVTGNYTTTGPTLVGGPHYTVGAPLIFKTTGHGLYEYTVPIDPSVEPEPATEGEMLLDTLCNAIEGGLFTDGVGVAFEEISAQIGSLLEQDPALALIAPELAPIIGLNAAEAGAALLAVCGVKGLLDKAPWVNRALSLLDNAQIHVRVDYPGQDSKDLQKAANLTLGLVPGFDFSFVLCEFDHIDIAPQPIPPLKVGDSFPVTAVAKGENNAPLPFMNRDLLWTSSDPSVVDLDPRPTGYTATLLAKKEGAATITVTDSLSGKTGSVTVSVSYSLDGSWVGIIRRTEEGSGNPGQSFFDTVNVWEYSTSGSTVSSDHVYGGSGHFCFGGFGDFDLTTYLNASECPLDLGNADRIVAPQQATEPCDVQNSFVIQGTAVKICTQGVWSKGTFVSESEIVWTELPLIQVVTLGGLCQKEHPDCVLSYREIKIDSCRLKQESVCVGISCGLCSLGYLPGSP